MHAASQFVRRAVVALLLPLGCAWAQGLPPTTATWADSTRDIVLPLETVHDLVIVRVSVNGSRPLRMILDTGAPVMLVPDTMLARELGLQVLGRANVGGAGDEAPRSAPIAGNIHLSIGGLEVRGALAVLGIGGDVIPGVDGVVGAAVFQHAAVTIDWDAREVRLQVPSRYRPAASADVLPLEVRSSLHAYIKGELDPDGRGAIPVNLHLDTGARLALNVYRTNFAAAERISTPVRGVIVAWGSRGASRGDVGRITTLRLGRQVLPGVVSLLPRESALPGDEALLGLPVLRRFRVTIDYTGGRLALEPTARITDPFHYSALGATYRPAAEGAGARIIASLIPGSPAESAGLAEGDSIVAVNGQGLGSMTADELRSSVLTPLPDRELTIEYVRGGRRQVVTVRTRDLLGG